MRKSTIKLTKHELDFASDTIYPETKQSIMLKLKELFTACGQKLNQNSLYRDWTNPKHFKITQGEQHKQLPYMVLDTPQIKGPEFECVLRTMFWWGHYFSCNLVIRTDKLHSKQNLEAILELPKTRILTGTDLWEQDLDSDAFERLSNLSEKELKNLLETHNYLKLSRKIALKKYADLPQRVDAVYSEWLAALSIKKGAD